MNGRRIEKALIVLKYGNILNWKGEEWVVN